MVSAGLCMIDSIAAIQTVVKIGHIYALLLDNTGVNTTRSPVTTVEGPVLGESKVPVSIKQFARQELCKDFDGNKYFYNAMKTKFCSLTLTFTANHVLSLCRKRDFMLDNWVSELFDFDGGIS
ncbi:uncharacterized protein LOC123538641 isoform X2 [Mercenaria mercenaria]|uniref:uncharacterized protein LOC123538641 isoform X2 n=1 Tax=Mercenaria mercenaria TaxID=6596 RepID=UPI00234F5C6B|nr:uncharacterized protein LOC123538641 isoform X2 [Mercenaria mercenaria]